jgi:homoserine dehydrogenase
VGISDVDLRDQQHAAAFGGALRPIVLADWNASEVTAYAGPAYVDGSSALCRVDGVQNAIALSTRWSGELFFSGPGAGPTVTAATVLDDVTEASAEGCPIAAASRTTSVSSLPVSGWFVRLTSSSLGEADAPSLLASLGIRLRRVSHIDARSACHSQWLLTHPCKRDHIDAALGVLSSKNSTAAWRIPVLE